MNLSQRCATRASALALLLWLSAWLPEASAEWYLAGYGGVSTGGVLRDVTMNNLGERLALQQLPPGIFNPTDVAFGSFTQSFNTANLSLKSSPIFGGKAGYFFSDEGFSWLGVEVEAYTTKPSIRKQTVRSHQEITYTPNQDQGVQCFDPIPPSNCPKFIRSDGQVSLADESELRVTTVALNVIARYPGQIVQPYLGVGAGAVYFSSSSGPVQGRQWVPGLNVLAGFKLFFTDEWGVFAEGKYNYATISTFDPTFGVSGAYSMLHAVGGIAYRF